MENNKNELAERVAEKVVDSLFSTWLCFMAITMIGMGIICFIGMFTTDTKTGVFALGCGWAASLLMAIWLFNGAKKRY